MAYVIKALCRSFGVALLTPKQGVSLSVLPRVIMNKIDKELELRLTKTFKLYINVGLENALSDAPSEIEVLQTIINMQAALELLSKYYILQREGWKGIVIEKYHNKDEEEIVELIKNGSIQTTSHQKNKKYFTENIDFDDFELDLLDKFQKSRNQVMHLGVTSVEKEILSDTIIFMVRIIKKFRWSRLLPIQEQYLNNTLESLVGTKLYRKLITSSIYIGESVDAAYESTYDDIKYCVNCLNESWVFNKGDWECFTCGFKGSEQAFGFIDCPKCNAEGELVYDACNVGINEFIRAKCSKCGQFSFVSKCKSCRNVKCYPGVCEICD